jgi:hypothetical protein
VERMSIVKFPVWGVCVCVCVVYCESCFKSLTVFDLVEQVPGSWGWSEFWRGGLSLSEKGGDPHRAHGSVSVTVQIRDKEESQS